MTRREAIPVIVVSALLFIYSLLIGAGSSSPFIEILFFISPLLVIWLVYNVLRYGKYQGPELKEDEEWGYADKEKK